LADIPMIAFVDQPRAFRFPDEKPRPHFVGKLRELMASWFHSLADAAMLVALLLFAAMAILVIIYVALFLVAFILSLWGAA